MYEDNIPEVEVKKTIDAPLFIFFFVKSCLQIFIWEKKLISNIFLTSSSFKKENKECPEIPAQFTNPSKSFTFSTKFSMSSFIVKSATM